MDKKVKLLIAGSMLLSFAVIIAVLAVLHKTLPPVVYIVVGIFFILDLLVVFVIFASPVKRTQISSTPMGQAGVIPYSDSLISIDDEGITIRLFYFPFGAKRVNFSDVEVVQALKGGSMRMWGSDDFRTWFGLDWGRMSRPMTFVIKQKNKWSRVGFTCEDSDSVAEILRSKNLLQINA
jgi:hypothetical protein